MCAPGAAGAPHQDVQAAARTRELEKLESIAAVFRSYPVHAAPHGLAGAGKHLLDSGVYQILSSRWPASSRRSLMRHDLWDAYLPA